MVIGCPIFRNWKLIIQHFCPQDDEMNLAKSLESNCSQIYSKMFSLEKELNLLFSTISVNNNNNVNNNNENSESCSHSTLNCFTYSPIYFQTDLKIA